MTCLLLRFPRWRRLLDDLSRDAVLRRVRFGARAVGCNRTQAEFIEARGAGLLDAKKPARDVLAECRSLAQSLAAGEHPPLT